MSAPRERRDGAIPFAGPALRPRTVAGRRAARRTVAAALACLLALACSKSEKEQPATTPAGEAAPADGDRLIIGTTADVDALNFLVLTTLTAQDVIDQLSWPLARFNPDFLTFRPGLADSWEFSPDSLSLTFHLNPKAAWHDGVPLTADDVVWSIGACKDPKIAWSAIRWLDRIKQVEAVDSLTVRFDFTERYPYQLMDASACYPLPKHLLEKVKPEDMRNAPFNSNPVGNGPFKFKSWTPQQSVELVANDKFFKGRPHLDGIVWRVIPEWTSVLTQLSTGDLDMATQVPPSFYPTVEKITRDNIYSKPGRKYVYVAWNIVNPLFADRNVRRALTMAIDRQQLIDALLYGQGQVMSSPFPSSLWAHDPNVKPIPYDPEGAKRLLAEAGWKDTDGDGILDKDGKPFRFELLTNTDNTLRVDITVAIQSQLKKIGIDAQPRGMEFVVFTQRLQNKDFQAAVAGWNSQIKVDLTDLWATEAIKDKFNFISYSNPVVDSLNELGIREFDPERAKRIWGEAQQIIAGDAGYTFLFEQNDITPLDKRFHGVEMNPAGWGYNVEDWFVPKGEQKY
jgi:peptide/nickel transport system substrate-binding protein